MQTYSPKRLRSLDVFRGITIALMIIVNSPGNSHPYDFIEHSAWNGCTLADLIFPFFIFITGLSSVLALSSLKHQGALPAQLFKKIIRRSLYIFFTGVLLNAASRHIEWSTLRIMGVLQRIAICYFFSATLYLTTTIRTQALVVSGLLIGYASLTFMFPLQNLAYQIDASVLGTTHLYSPTFEPEGILSTCPSLASVLLGSLTGFVFIKLHTSKQRLQRLLTAATGLTLAGGLLHLILPFNKSLWSSSYVLWSSGLALFSLSMLYALIEIKHWYRWSKPFEWFGKHAMLVYVLHILGLKIQAMMPITMANGESINSRIYLTHLFFNQLTPQNAALAYATGYTLLWLLVAYGMEKWRPLGRALRAVDLKT